MISNFTQHALYAILILFLHRLTKISTDWLSTRSCSDEPMTSSDIDCVVSSCWHAGESKHAWTKLSAQSSTAILSLWLSQEISEKHVDGSAPLPLPITLLLTSLGEGLTSHEDVHKPLSSNWMSSAERKSFGEISASDNDCTASGLYSTNSKTFSSYHCENVASDGVVESLIVAASLVDCMLTDKSMLNCAPATYLMVDCTILSISYTDSNKDPVVISDSIVSFILDSSIEDSFTLIVWTPRNYDMFYLLVHNCTYEHTY